jgi:hypothetical protein
VLTHKVITNNKDVLDMHIEDNMAVLIIQPRFGNEDQTLGLRLNLDDLCDLLHLLEIAGDSLEIAQMSKRKLENDDDQNELDY